MEWAIFAGKKRLWADWAGYLPGADESPFRYDSFIRNSMPVYSGVFPGSAWPLRLLAV